MEKIARGPRALVLLEGIYDISLLLRDHDDKNGEEAAQIYQGIVTGAFDADEEVWRSASPVSGSYGRDILPEGQLVVVGHSPEDGLVEKEQDEMSVDALLREGWGAEGEGRALEMKGLKGNHDEMWRDGRLAEVIGEVAERVVLQGHGCENVGCRHLAMKGLTQDWGTTVRCPI